MSRLIWIWSRHRLAWLPPPAMPSNTGWCSYIQKELKPETCCLSPEPASSSENNTHWSLTESLSAAWCIQEYFWHLQNGAGVTVSTIVHYFWRDTEKLLKDFRSRIACGQCHGGRDRGLVGKVSRSWVSRSESIWKQRMNVWMEQKTHGETWEQFWQRQPEARQGSITGIWG